MDKEEFRVKLEEINHMVERQDYKGAMEVVDSIDWRRVKNVRTLCVVGEIYAANNRYDDSRDIFLLAYHRASIGKNILYRLVEISLKMGDIEEAMEYYDEFKSVAPNDNTAYVLEYKILKEKNAPLEEQIAALEKYKEREFTEKWSYELANLYYRAGMNDQCESLCNEIILWFNEGNYVMKALNLKMRMGVMTEEEKAKYEQSLTQNLKTPEEEDSREEEVLEEDSDLPEEKKAADNSGKGYEELNETSSEERDVPVIDSISVNDERDLDGAETLQEKISKGIRDLFGNRRKGADDEEEEEEEDDESFEDDDFSGESYENKRSENVPALEKGEERLARRERFLKRKSLEESSEDSEEESVRENLEDNSEYEESYAGSPENEYSVNEDSVNEDSMDEESMDEDSVEESSGEEEVTEENPEDEDFMDEDSGEEEYTEGRSLKEASAKAISFATSIKDEIVRNVKLPDISLLKGIMKFRRDVEEDDDFEDDDFEDDFGDDFVDELPKKTRRNVPGKAKKAVTEARTETEEPDEIEIISENAKKAFGIADDKEFNLEDTILAAATAQGIEIPDEGNKKEEDFGEETEEEAEDFRNQPEKSVFETEDGDIITEEDLEEAEKEFINGPAVKPENEAKIPDLSSDDVQEYDNEPLKSQEENEKNPVSQGSEESFIPAEVSESKINVSEKETADTDGSEKESLEEEVSEENIPESEIYDEQVPEGETSDAVVSDAVVSDAVVSDAETSDAVVSDTETIDAEKPDAQKPDPENPDEQKPYAENIDAQKPDAENIDAQKPYAENIDAQKPGVENIDAESPDEEKPDSENTGAVKSDAENSAEKAFERIVSVINAPAESESAPVWKTAAENMAVAAAADVVENISGKEVSEKENPEEGSPEDEAAEAEENPSLTEEEKLEKFIDSINSEENDNPSEIVPREHRLSEEEKKLFSYFVKVPGMKEQIVDALCDVQEGASDKTSNTGNIIVMGGSESGKTRLISALIPAICRQLNLEATKVAYVFADQINGKDIDKIFRKLAGGFFVIEKSNQLDQETALKLEKAMSQDTDGLIVILEDDKIGMRKMITRYQRLARKFTSVINIPVFTNDELANFARIYAVENGYKIDNMAMLALYNLISVNQKADVPMNVGAVKNIVDAAIDKSKGRLRLFNKMNSRKRTDAEGFIILSEKDFSVKQ